MNPDASPEQRAEFENRLQEEPKEDQPVNRLLNRLQNGGS